MSGVCLSALVDVLLQVTETGVDHAQREQLLRQANDLFRVAVEARNARAEFLLEVERRAEKLSGKARGDLLVTVHRILREQVAFGEACVSILDERTRKG